MKAITYLLLSAATVLTFIACSSDDDSNQESQTGCNCYYTLVEGGQPQEGWTQLSDSTDCSLNEVHVYYDNYMNGEPNETYYRVLHCNPE